MRITSPLDTIIGTNIRARRRKLGMTQHELGQRLGITHQQVQKYEVGMSQVRSTVLVLMCEILGCTPSELLDYKVQETGVSKHELTVSNYRELPEDDIKRGIRLIINSLAERMKSA